MSDIIDIQTHMEMERAYNVRLTEVEMLAIAKAIKRLYALESKDHRLPAEGTFHLMHALDKFGQLIDAGKFIMIKKERLPI